MDSDKKQQQPKAKPEPHDGKLRFYAKRDLLVTVPGSGTARYVNRTPKLLDNGGAAWPAVEKPYAVEPNTDAGRRLALLCRRDDSLFPADEYTAKHCGVKFKNTRFVNGEHVED